MVGPQVPGDRPGMLALVEARVLEADRERPDVPRRLDLAERRGDARGIDAAGEEDPQRHVRPPVPRHRVAELAPRTARPSPRSPAGSVVGAGGCQYRLDPHFARFPHQDMARGSFRSDRQIECGAGTYS